MTQQKTYEVLMRPAGKRIAMLADSAAQAAQLALGLHHSYTLSARLGLHAPLSAEDIEVADATAAAATAVDISTPDVADCMRRCEHCGRPMQEGYCLDGEWACSEECAVALYDGDRAAFESDLAAAEEDDGEVYWTEWESVWWC